MQAKWSEKSIGITIVALYVFLLQCLPFYYLTEHIFYAFIPGNVMNMMLLGMIGYVWVPLGSIIFIILLIAVSRVRPEERPTPEIGERRFPSEPSRTRKFKTFIENPSYVLLISAPIALFYLIFTPLRTLTFIVAFLVAIGPYALFYELKAKTFPTKASLPNFLRSLSYLFHKLKAKAFPPKASLSNFLSSLSHIWRSGLALIVIAGFFCLLSSVFFIIDACVRLPTGMVIGGIMMGWSVEAIEIKLLFYRTCAFQAGSSGIVAGWVKNGNLRSGLKYAILLSIVVLIFFEWLILPMAPPLPSP
jgi:hypothetical protein